MKQQVCVIHGGNTYKNNEDYLAALRHKELSYEQLLYSGGWRPWLAAQLTGWDVIMPSMPSKQNAQYEEWALYFSKVVPYLDSSAVLVGHSLGGVFLARYFTDHPPSEPFAKLILLAAPYNDETRESLAGFKLSDASGLSSAAHDIHVFHSQDDPVVPFAESAKYIHDLPSAQLHVFETRHHFIDDTFPELLGIIA